VAQDALDDGAVADERDDVHFTGRAPPPYPIPSGTFIRFRSSSRFCNAVAAASQTERIS
jgi:hypothetical protein